MGTECDQSRPPWSSRLLGGAWYLCLGPLLSLVGRWRRDVYICHHRQQALITVSLLCLVALALPTYFAIEVYLVRHYSQPQMPDPAITFLPGLGLWGLLSVVGIVMSLAGSTRSIPLVGRLGRSQWLTTLAWLGNSILLGIFVLVVGLAIHASWLAREDAVPAPVYYLYDNRDHAFLGTWGQKLFCYRISRVAQERWGPGSVVVAPITGENLRIAIAHGRFVVLISHGSSGAIRTIDNMNAWPDASGGPVAGKDRQLVYISACCGGEKTAEWRQVLAPAEVVTFDRLSAGGEHLWWLWFEAPDRLKEIR